jgi:uncharacterized protein GlcG (DUF336 family)
MVRLTAVHWSVSLLLVAVLSVDSYPPMPSELKIKHIQSTHDLVDRLQKQLLTLRKDLLLEQQQYNEIIASLNLNKWTNLNTECKLPDGSVVDNFKDIINIFGSSENLDTFLPQIKRELQETITNIAAEQRRRGNVLKKLISVRDQIHAKSLINCTTLVERVTRKPGTREEEGTRKPGTSQEEGTKRPGTGIDVDRVTRKPGTSEEEDTKRPGTGTDVGRTTRKPVISPDEVDRVTRKPGTSEEEGTKRPGTGVSKKPGLGREDDDDTIVTRKPGTGAEVERVTRKPTIETSVTRRITKCVRLSNKDSMCVEIVDVDGEKTVTIKRNDKVIDVIETTGDVKDIFDKIFKKYVKDDVTETIVTRTRTRCIKSKDAEICIEVVDVNGNITVTTKKNDVVVDVRKTTGDISDVLDEETRKYIKKPQIDKPGTSVTRTTNKCVKLPNKDIICIEIVDVDGKKTVTVKKNNKVTEVIDSTDDVKDIFEKLIKKYVPDDVTETIVTRTRTRCIKSKDVEICIEVVDVNGNVTVTTKKNDVVVDVRKTKGDLTHILDEETIKYIKKPQIEKPGTSVTKITTKCVTSANKDTVCIEIVDVDEKKTVTIKKNNKVVGVVESTDDVKDIFDKLFKKYVTEEITETIVTRTRTRCIQLKDEEICIEVVDVNGNVTVTTRKNDVVVNIRNTKGDITDILDEETRKYVKKPQTEKPGTSITKTTTKCVTLVNTDIICVEIVDEDGKKKVTNKKNGQVLTVEDSTEDVEVIFKRVLDKYNPKDITKKIVTRIRTRCIPSGKDLICIEVVEMNDKIMVTVRKNKVIIDSHPAKGDVADVLDEETKKYLDDDTTEEVTSRTKTKCINYSNGDKVCIEIVDEEGILTITTKKNGSIVNVRKIKGNITKVLDEEIKKYLDDNKTEDVTAKTKTKCINYSNGDKLCVEIVDEEGILTITTKKNGSVVNVRKIKGNITTVLEEEIKKYLDDTPTEEVTARTKTKCAIFPNGDKICVEIVEEEGVLTITTKKNGSVVNVRKAKGNITTVLDEEIKKYIPKGDDTEKVVGRKATRCLTASNSDTICFDAEESSNDTIIIKVRKNGSVVDTIQSTGKLSEVLDKEFNKYHDKVAPKGSGSQVVGKKSGRCRTNEENVTVCVAILEANGKKTVTTKKNGTQVNKRETTGSVADIYEEEFNKYLTK